MQTVEPIYGDLIAERCDYSFGDHGGVICGISGSFMKSAHHSNTEFVEFVNSFKQKRPINLFIDNVRLYRRPIPTKCQVDADWIRFLHEKNDLLKLCSRLKHHTFRIFTNLDDTQIDSCIDGRIPSNVINVFAVNCLFFNQTLRPAYLGLQRKMRPGDNRVELLKTKMTVDEAPTKLLYVNHKDWTNQSIRGPIKPIFQPFDWATVRDAGLDYSDYLSEIKDHEFMICPEGNGVDCHRNYEVLYLRRVPVMVKNNYLQELLAGLPILWVDSWGSINRELLESNRNLLDRARSTDVGLLDWNHFSYRYQ